MSQSPGVHALVEFQVEIPVELANYFHYIDQTAKVAAFLRSEVEWLISEKNRVETEIDKQAEEYINQLKDKKKRELNQLLQEKIKLIDDYIKAEIAEFLLGNIQQLRHLEGFEYKFFQLNVDSLMKIKQSERVYQFPHCHNNGLNFIGRIEAFSFQVSKRIILKGLGLPRKAYSAPLSLYLLQILKGCQTSGEILYSDTGTRSMESTCCDLVKVMVKKHIVLLPNLQYTVQVQLFGRSGHSSCSVNPGPQDGLEITISKSVANEFYVPESGIIFELYYL